MQTPPATASVRPPRPPRSQTVLEVLGHEWRTPRLVRLRLGGEGLRTFEPNAFTDAYVKLVFVPGRPELAPPYDLEALRETLPPENQPVTRTYTIVDVDDTGFSVDFVVHGDEGIAAPWAVNASIGDQIAIQGPGGAYAPDSDAAWHLLLGDESALPAIEAALKALPADATGAALIEVHDADDQLPLAMPHGVEVRWLHRGDPTPASTPRLAETVAGLEWPDGRVHVFAHGERESMKALRDELFKRRGLERSQVSISGYWALGRTEDRFQAEKREPIGVILPPEG